MPQQCAKTFLVIKKSCLLLPVKKKNERKQKKKRKKEKKEKETPRKYNTDQTVY